MSNANSHQVGGAHYAAPYQHWDLIEDASLGYLEGCATKYLVRVKNGVEDVKKALHYVDKLIERAEAGTRVPFGLAERHLVDYFMAVNNVEIRRAVAIRYLVGDWELAHLYSARTVILEIIRLEDAPERTADVLPFVRPGQDAPTPVPPALEQRTPPPLETKDGVGLCEDEGCDHFGTPHVCVDRYQLGADAAGITRVQAKDAILAADPTFREDACEWRREFRLKTEDMRDQSEC